MTFAGISAAATAALAIGVAGVLAALHLLRVRPRRVTVVTTLFWRPAAERTLARRLPGRFRHPLTYLLLTLIGVLLALALGRPQATDAGDQLTRVVVLAADAALTGADDQRWAQAVDLATRFARDDDSRAALIVAAPWPRLVQGFDDSPLLLSRRLAQLVPALQPADRAAALRLAETLIANADPAEIVLVTAATDEPNLPTRADLPLRVARVEPPDANAGILSAVFTPRDADPFRGDLTVRIGNWGQPRRLTLTAARDGASPLQLTQPAPADATAEFTLPDLPANGATLTCTLAPGDDFPADDVLRVALPLRSPVRVFVAAAPPTLRALLLGSGETRILDAFGDADAAVLAATAEALPPLAQPALLLADDGPALPEPTPVTLAYDERDGLAAADALIADLDFTGAAMGGGNALTLREGETPVLLAGDAVVAAFGQAGGRRYLRLSRALFADDASACRHPALAALLTRTLRDFAGWNDRLVTLPAGRIVADPLWTQRHELATAAAPLAQRPLAAQAASDAAAPSVGGAPLAWFEWLLLAALVAWLAETTLHARGRIP